MGWHRRKVGSGVVGICASTVMLTASLTVSAEADDRFPTPDSLAPFALAPQEAAVASGATGGLQILNHEGGNTCSESNRGFVCRRSWFQPVQEQVYPFALSVAVFPTREDAARDASFSRGYIPGQEGVTGIVLENESEMAVSYSHAWGSDSVRAIAQSGPYVVEVSCVVRRGNGSVDQMLACAQATIDAQFRKIAGTRRVIEPPGPPTNITANLDGRSVLLTWSAPARDGGSPITSYTVTSDEDGLTCSVQAAGPEGSCTVSGIRPGVDYLFSVTAANAAGVGAPSGSVSPGRFAARPGAPRSLSVKRRSDDVTVRWKAPTDTGGSPLRGYVVTASPGDRTCTSTRTSCTISDLPGGITYRFTVRARSDQGLSLPARTPRVQIPAPPAPPPAVPAPAPPPVEDKPPQTLT